MLGINAQNSIRSIHYVNLNILGPRSAQVLSTICRRDTTGHRLHELNISSVRIGKPGNLAGPSILQEVTSSVAAVGELRSIKLSNLDLDDAVIIENLLQLLRSSYHLIYCNLSCCQIQVHDLIRVVNELAKGTKLEYCELGGNRVRRPTMGSGAASGKAANVLETEALKPQARQAQLSEKLASAIGSMLEQPQSVLKFLGVADLGLPSHGLRRVAWSLQKNVILRSINFGVIDEERDLVMLSRMLGVE